MGKAWSDAAIRKLVDWKACPRCDFAQLDGGWCPNCGADLTGPEAVTLAAASNAAVEALETRERTLEKLPIRKREAVVELVATSRPVSTGATTGGGSSTGTERPSSQISVQSVLAVAGAGLFAIAAIVFTFFNPDLADPTTRNTIVAIISVVFLGAAWLLARAGLQFSAEAVGALGMVFVVLDIWAISTALGDGRSSYGVAAIATLVIAGIMILLASIRRLRTWLWAGLVAASVTPLLAGFSDGGAWPIVLGTVGVGFAALAVHELVKRLEKRFSSPLIADHGTATLVQFLVLPSVIAQLPFLEADTSLLRVGGTAAILAALALMAALATRNGAAAVWSYLAGFLATAALAILPLAHDFGADEWVLALLPAAAAGAAALLAVATLVGAKRERHVVNRTTLLAGAFTVTIAAVTPPALTAVVQVLSAPFNWVPITIALPALLGVTAVTLGTGLVAAVRRSAPIAAAALWIGTLALCDFATWSYFSDPIRVTVSLTIAAVLAAIATWVRPVAAAPLWARIPLLTGTHVLLIVGALISFSDELLTIFGGIGVVAASVILVIAMPRITRPFYVALGYGYALGIFAFTLATQTILSDFAVLGLTTALAGLAAIAVTVVKAARVPYWYAVLTVTAIPFVISIFSMLFEISGWTGLSTGVVFLLAVTLVVVHRPGLTVFLRGLGAALLLPTLAVVVIDVVAQLVSVSTSPITLPVIAGIVALTLPSTGAVGSALLRRGHDETHARVVQLLLEISALVTGSIAVLLTVVRAAAGFDTTFLVLVIIGLGAAATGLFRHRRYAWIVAFISFTGALWSLLALNRVDSVELYILPPAIAAAVIGAIAVGRGRRGLGFYAVGLSIAAATPLALLATRGNPDGTVEWRTLGLLAGAVALTVVGGLLGGIAESSRFAKLSRLQVPTLLVAIGAASAGAVQAVRYGWDWDHTVLGNTERVLLPVLMFSGGALLLAAFAAFLLAVRHPNLAASRWLYVPALVFLVAGPIASLRSGWAYPITMLALALAILTFMIITIVVGRTARAITLPPVWVTFGVAWFTAVAGWAERDHLRVEAFSIPLGLALLAAGIIAMRPVKDVAPTFTSWPIGHQGSWRLLAPGIIVTLLPSVLATATDPRTERAVLVIALALIAILIGNLRKLAAPFILGIIALPVENLIVFLVQVGDKIAPTTWWITLATAGAVLLVLAVSSERGSTGDRGVAARLRDLK